MKHFVDSEQARAVPLQWEGNMATLLYRLQRGTVLLQWPSRSTLLCAVRWTAWRKSEGGGGSNEAASCSWKVPSSNKSFEGWVQQVHMRYYY